MAVTVDVPHDARSASVARRRLTAELSDHLLPRDLVDDAALLLSELIGNAVRHADPLPGGTVRIGWDVDVDRVRVQVIDGGSTDGHRPVQQHVGPEAVTGRGLAIVSMLASAWGVEDLGPGQRIWAEVAGT